tara:strand:+ start:448 stop:1803 length:1356 start_codon:yes stop_codon:yes gene_type:complete
VASNISKDQFFNIQSNPNLDAADTGVDPTTGRLLSKKERIAIFRRRKINAKKVFGRSGSIVKVNQQKPNNIMTTLVATVSNVQQTVQKITSFLTTDAENENQERRESLRTEKVENEKDRRKRKEGLLEGVGKSVGNSLLKPVQGVIKKARGAFSRLGDALLALLGGFVVDKFLKMIQANASGDTDTFKKMRSGLIQGLLVLGGTFLIASRGLMLIPDLIFGTIRAVRNIGKISKTLFSIFKKGPGKILPRLATAVGGKKVGKLFMKKAGKEVTEKVAKEGIKNVGKQVAKKTAKNAVKKGLGKALAKKIPLLGLGLGAIFAAQRAMAGDFSGAALELASGAASTIPGLGTAASVGIDAALIAKDTGAFDQKNTGEKVNNTLEIEKPKLKTNIARLEDPAPTIIDMTRNQGTNTQQVNGSSGNLATNVPNISSSDPDNTFTLYSQTQYNMVV